MRNTSVGNEAMTPLERRAFAAYYRVVIPGADVDHAAPQATTKVADGHHYVILSADHEIIAVYRVRNDDQLKRLRRWPAALSTTAED
jgi:hypothetical protein